MTVSFLEVNCPHCMWTVLEAHYETFSALHLSEHTQLSRWGFDRNWTLSKVKPQPSMWAGLISESADVKVHSWWLFGFFSADMHALLWALTSDRCSFAAESVGERLLSIRSVDVERDAPDASYPLFIIHISVSVRSSHQCLCCGVTDRKQLVPWPPAFSLIVFIIPVFLPAAPQTHPQEARSLSPRHLWVTPDGEKASGNERKQPILSEHIRTAVHHAADLQGVCVCVCVNNRPQCIWVCVQVCAY